MDRLAVIFVVFIIVLGGMGLTMSWRTPGMSAQALAMLSDEFDNQLGDGYTILDVRTLSEYETGYIDQALHIDYYDASFRESIDALDRDATYVVYCRTGRRSAETVRMMQQMGFSNVYDLEGGISVWSAKGYPVTPCC